MSHYTYILSQWGGGYTMQECRLGLNTFTVSFIGHRIIENPLRIEKQLEALIRRLMHEKEYVVFLVVRDGEFDQIVSSVIRRCKRVIRDDNSAHVWVLPYPSTDFRDNEAAYRDYYDEIEICAISAEGHFKNAYQTRNREMVDRSNLVVFCIQHENGGAWQTMKYVQKISAAYLNLNEKRENI